MSVSVPLCPMIWQRLSGVPFLLKENVLEALLSNRNKGHTDKSVPIDTFSNAFRGCLK